MCLTTATAGVAAEQGEADKDCHHEAADSFWLASIIFIWLILQQAKQPIISSLAWLDPVRAGTCQSESISAVLCTSQHIHGNIQLFPNSYACMYGLLNLHTWM